MASKTPVPHTCKLCGTLEKNRFSNSTELTKLQVCFTCNFWLEKLNLSEDPNIVRCVANRTGGVLTHYVIGTEPSEATLRQKRSNMYGSSFGHAGGKFIIKFNDGRIVTTHNLWCQGAIPEYFQPFLPANAVFLEEY